MFPSERISAYTNCSVKVGRWVAVIWQSDKVNFETAREQYVRIS